MDTRIVHLVNVVAIATSLLLLGNVGCQQTPAPDTYERVQVNSNGTNDSPTPDNLRVTFRFGSSYVYLFLQRNPNVPPNVPLIVRKNGTVTRIQVDSSKTFAHYIDLSSEASVLVTAEIAGDGSVSHSFKGVFKIGADTYAIEPVPSTPSRRRRSLRRMRRRRGLRRIVRDAQVVSELHIVHKDHTQLDATSPSLSLPPELLKSPFAERQDPDASNGGNSVDKPPEKPNYIVELMAFVDYSIYKKMYDLSTESDKASDTIDRIRQYFGHIINGVDLRYRGINDSSFSVNVRLVGVHIAQDADSAPYIEKNRQGNGSSSYVAAQRAAYDFADWLDANKGQLKTGFDQASLFTSEFLNGANGDRISGLAFLRSICSYYSVLVVRDSGEYGSSQTAAHELGHNLGAGHDGIDNSCSASEQHIMVASSGPLTDAVYKNAYTFSTCSSEEMRSYISTGLPNNCLLKQSNTSLPDIRYDIPLGTLYRPDAQCAMLYGNGSFYCGGQSEDQQICRTMGCFHPVWQYCVTSVEQRAFSGTQCGDHKWCFMGDCVYDSKANGLDGSEVCMYGDSKAPFFDGFKCSNVTSQPWNCYKQPVADQCCRSCAAVEDDSLLGCEYGDRYAGCQYYDPLDCNDPSINTMCCRTCSDQQRTKPICDGDRIAGCSATDCLDATKYDDCCRTCASYSVPLPPAAAAATTTTLAPTTTTQTTTPTTTPNSRPASISTTVTTPTTTPKASSSPTTSTTTRTMATSLTIPTTTQKKATTTLSPSCTDVNEGWCRNPKNFPTYYCYTYMDYCCAFCHSIADNSQPGCEYGDRASWCSTSRCPNEDERKTCCGTCKAYLTTSSTTSTTTTRMITTPTTTTTTTTTSTSTTPTTTTTRPTTTTTPTTTISTTTTKTPTTTTTPTTRIPTTTTTTPTKTTTPTSTTSTTTPTTTRLTTTIPTLRATKPLTTVSSVAMTVRTTPPVSRPTGNPVTAALSARQTSMDPTCRDFSSLCDKIDVKECYSATTRTMCCKMCTTARAGPPGCEYGDREYSLCVRVNPDDCYLYYEECCRTCQHF